MSLNEAHHVLNLNSNRSGRWSILIPTMHIFAFLRKFKKIGKNMHFYLNPASFCPTPIRPESGVMAMLFFTII